MNRREFLLKSTGRSARSVEMSCERLYMKYLDSRLHGTTARLFESLEAGLRNADELRLVDSAWLSREELKQPLEAILAAFRARGGRVRFKRGTG